MLFLDSPLFNYNTVQVSLSLAIIVPKIIRGAKNAPPGRKSLFFHPVKIGLMLVKDMFGNKSSTFHSGPFILLKLEFSISNWQCKLQCHINHGPEWNVEFSIPIQTPYKHFDCCWVLID